MKKSLNCLGVSACLALASAAYAQPANDLCTSAIPLTAGTPVIVDNVGAGTEGSALCVGTTNSDVWYSYTATADGFITVGTTAIAGATLNDTTMTILDACGGVELACDDDSGPGFFSLINSFAVTSGTTYIIRVASWGGSPQGQCNLSLTLNSGGPPANDDCAGAVTVTLGSTNFDNTFAATNGTPGTCVVGGSDGADLWFRFVAPSAGLYSFDTNLSTGLTDTTMQLFSVCGGAELACDDDAGTGFLSQISYTAAAGEEILVRVAGWGTAPQRGAGTLSIVAATPPANDTCATAASVGVGTTAWDNSFANTDGPSASCTFGGVDGADIYYTFTPPAAGAYRIDTNGSTIGDTTLALYSACAGAEIACDDDSGTGLLSQLTYVATTTDPVIIRVASWGATPIRGAGLLNIAPVVLQPGDTCATALTASLGNNEFDNSNYNTDSPAASCAFFGLDGKDIWYTFTAPAAGSFTFDTLLSTGQTDTTLEIFDACGGASLTCNDDAGGGLLSRAALAMTAGQTVRVRVASWGENPAGGAATLRIGELNCAPFAIPAGATDEGEPCNLGAPDAVNGGCNSVPEAFGSIGCGQTVTGTSWWSNGLGSRDTDWFAFTLSAETNVRLRGQAEFNAVIFLISIPDCTSAAVVADSANLGAACPEFDFNSTVPAGNYVAFIAPSFAGPDVFCGTGDRYWLNLQLNAPTGCDLDFNNDCDFPTPLDIEDFITVLAGGACSSGPGACDSLDFNRDGDFPSPLDLELFIEANGGNCPF